ncbi:MAG: hypothetical protein BZY88_12190 [SAR202 cluster bacterium Io17-Chloro-G9]|nr:MAG: hypothetical protein BZY88_12190 [SAR202 cluster bacterium Io17-Chloro-G9]
MPESRTYFKPWRGKIRLGWFLRLQVGRAKSPFLENGWGYLQCPVLDSAGTLKAAQKGILEQNDPTVGFPRLPQSRFRGLVDAFRYPDFRVLWISTVSNQLGQGMQQVILGWLVLDMTGSVGMVGVVFAVRSAPNLVVGFIAGSVTDRIDRRVLMRASVFGMMGVSLLGAIFLYGGFLTIWQIMLGTFLLGVSQAFYMTSRQVYAYDIVGTDAAVNGIALISMAQRVGGIFGSLIAGSFLAWLGPADTFLVMSVSYALGGIVLYWLRQVGQSAPAEREPIWDNVVNYFRALADNRIMLSLMVTTAAVEMLGFSHQVLLPVLAKDVLFIGPTGLGVLTAFRFLGGALGVVATAILGQVQRRGILLLAVIALFGGGEILLAYSNTLWTALVFITLINVMASITDILHQSLLQLSVPNQQRGRAMGSWIVGIGTAPVGQLQIGYLSGLASPKIALLVNGTALAVLAVAMGVIMPRLRRL